MTIRSLTVALPMSSRRDYGQCLQMISSLAALDCVCQVIVVVEETEFRLPEWIQSAAKLDFVRATTWISGETLNRLLQTSNGDALLLVLSETSLEFDHRGVSELMLIAEHFQAGLVYSDYRQRNGNEITDRPVIDYRTGSIRENFDFGRAVLVPIPVANAVLAKYGTVSDEVRWAAFYDLRLKLAATSPVVRAAEPLYVECVCPKAHTENTFYPDRGARAFQLECERIASSHLRRIGAYLEGVGSKLPSCIDNFPVTASIVIPVFNRERTIRDALSSAEGQTVSFPYNILVVDDHSTDKTGEIVQEFVEQHANVFRIIPAHEQLGVGGLWNEAIYSSRCGRYAVQLDSDDVFAHDRALEMLIDAFEEDRGSPKYAAVVGSYKSVNFDLQQIHSGVNQRLDFSVENGRNHLLAIDGVGAPRAFYVPVLRRIGFPKVSFGEDYAAALRITREFAVGRVFECIYLARQWEGNTARSLPLGLTRSLNVVDLVPPGMDQREFWNRMRPLSTPLVIASANRNHAYKDYLRTVELLARRKVNGRDDLPVGFQPSTEL